MNSKYFLATVCLVALCLQLENTCYGQQDPSWYSLFSRGKFEQYERLVVKKLETDLPEADRRAWQAELELLKPVLKDAELANDLAEAFRQLVTEQRTARQKSGSDREQARAIVESAMSRVASRFGRDHLYYARALQVRGAYMKFTGESFEAATSYRQAFERLQQTLPVSWNEVLGTGETCALQLAQLGQFDRQIEIYDVLLPAIGDGPHKESQRAILMRINLARALKNQDQLSRALKVLQPAYRIAREKHPDQHRLQSYMHDAIASIYIALGDNQTAVHHLQKSLEAKSRLPEIRGPYERERLLRQSDQFMQKGIIQELNGDYPEAIGHFTGAIRCLEENESFPRHAFSARKRLAEALVSNGQYDEALTQIETAYQGMLKIDASGGADLGKIVEAGSRVNRLQDNYEAALKWHERLNPAEGSEEAISHGILAEREHELGLIHLGMNQRDLSLKHLIAAYSHYQDEWKNNIAPLSDFQAQRFSMKTRNLIGSVFYADNKLPSSESSAPDAHVTEYSPGDELDDALLLTTMALESKGLVSNFIAQRESLLASEPFRHFRAHFSELNLEASDLRASGDQSSKLLKMEAQKRTTADEFYELLEKKGYWPTGKQILTDLLNSLDPSTAVIEVLKLAGPERADGSRPNFYLAFVIRKTESGKLRVTRIDLGNMEAVDQATATWLAEVNPAAQGNDLATNDASRGADPGIEPLNKKKRTVFSPSAKQLHEIVWSKIQPHVSGASHLVICPDGMLTQLPFAAVPTMDSEHPYLINQYSVSYSTCAHASAQSLQREYGTHCGRMLVAANIDYGSSEGDSQFPPLPFTEKEILHLKSVLADPAGMKLLSGRDATQEALLEEMPRNKTIYLATHGYLAEQLGDLVVRRQAIYRPSPLADCGLALSDANRIFGEEASAAEDNVLTAEEILQQDLTSVELAILSACHSASGAIYEGEGVFGIQKGLRLAGVATTISNLQSIGDESTSVFMKELNQRLFEESYSSLSRAEALREAQQAMVEQGLPPRYWANWVLYGDWR